MRNPTEDRLTMEFGWCYGGLSVGGVLRTLWKVEYWKSLGFNSVVEVRTEIDYRGSSDGDFLL